MSRAALGDQTQRLGQRPVEVEQVGDLGAARDLLHVHARAGIEHRAALRQRDHRQRVGHPQRGQARALQRIDGDVDLGRGPVADLLAVVEHRRLVLLALADHDDAVHRHRVEHLAHGVDGRLVGALLVAAADHPRGGERRGLGDAHQLQREVAIGLLARRGVHRTPGGLRPAALSLARHTEPVRIRRSAATATHHPPATVISLGGEPG